MADAVDEFAPPNTAMGVLTLWPVILKIPMELIFDWLRLALKDDAATSVEVAIFQKTATPTLEELFCWVIFVHPLAVTLLSLPPSTHTLMIIKSPTARLSGLFTEGLLLELPPDVAVLLPVATTACPFAVLGVSAQTSVITRAQMKDGNRVKRAEHAESLALRSER